MGVLTGGLSLLLPVIRTKQGCRYCIQGEPSSWLYPAEKTKMNGAEGPEIREAKMCLSLPGEEGVWSVVESQGRNARKTMLWSNVSARQGWPRAGIMSRRWEPRSWLSRKQPGWKQPGVTKQGLGGAEGRNRDQGQGRQEREAKARRKGLGRSCSNEKYWTEMVSAAFYIW